MTRINVTQTLRNEVAARIKSSPVGALDPAAVFLVADGFCPGCAGEANGFRDKLSVAEFRISGLCQNCQDAIFDGESREVPTDPSDPAFD